MYYKSIWWQSLVTHYVLSLGIYFSFICDNNIPMHYFYSSSLLLLFLLLIPCSQSFGRWLKKYSSYLILFAAATTVALQRRDNPNCRKVIIKSHGRVTHRRAQNHTTHAQRTLTTKCDRHRNQGNFLSTLPLPRTTHKSTPESVPSSPLDKNWKMRFTDPQPQTRRRGRGQQHRTRRRVWLQ